jgi:hypothetical protein
MLELGALFEQHDFNAFPVVEGDKMLGIVQKGAISCYRARHKSFGCAREKSIHSFFGSGTRPHMPTPDFSLTQPSILPTCKASSQLAARLYDLFREVLS